MDSKHHDTKIHKVGPFKTVKKKRRSKAEKRWDRLIVLRELINEHMPCRR